LLSCFGMASVSAASFAISSDVSAPPLATPASSLQQQLSQQLPPSAKNEVAAGGSLMAFKACRVCPVPIKPKKAYCEEHKSAAGSSPDITPERVELVLGSNTRGSPGGSLALASTPGCVWNQGSGEGGVGGQHNILGAQENMAEEHKKSLDLSQLVMCFVCCL
jgi:hypothetical protein